MQYPGSRAGTAGAVESRSSSPSAIPPRLSGLGWLFLLGALCAFLLLPTGRAASAAGGAASPTGRTPRLLWSPEQQAVWNRMRAENHPWWTRLKINADAAGTPNARYGDYGQWAAIAYQMTGDPVYAEKSWHQITRGLNGGSFLGTSGIPTGSSNFTREYLMDFVWMYDWLYPALSPAQRSQMLATVNYWADVILGKATASGVYWPAVLTDSDNTVGHYFGIVMLGLGTGPENPRAAEFLNHPLVGGLDATGANLNTNFRNAIRFYLERAEGGVWPEATGYNLATLRLLFQGAAAVRGRVGRDPYPEITRYQRDAARHLVHEMTPDLQACYQWGDIESQSLRSVHFVRRLTLTAMLAGLQKGDRQTGPYLRQLTDELTERLGQKFDPWNTMYLFCDPYASAADWRGALPKGFYASGVGLQLVRSDWHEGASYFGAQLPNRTRVQHEASWFGNFQLYRKGEWAVTHPLGYMLWQGETMNGMLIGGLSSSGERRGPVAQEFGPEAEFAYLAGTTGGQYYEQPYWNPPPTFLHEWTRSTFYLPSRDGLSDTVVLFDRVNAQDPKSLPSLDRYRSADRARIAAAPALKQWLLHTSEKPVLEAGGFSWNTPGGQKVRVSNLLPAARERVTIDEDALWPEGSGYPHKSEQKWQVRLSPAREQQWDTFLNVVQAHDPAASLRNTLVRSREGEAEGVLVQRAGHNDALVLFSAQEAARLLAQGYAVTWTAGSARTDVYLLDLAPGKAWSAAVDGKPASLEVSGQGVGRLSVSGAGTHTLLLETGAGGGSNDTTPPAAPSGLTATAGDGRAALAWRANGEADLAGYCVYRAVERNGTYALQNAKPVSAASLTQGGLSNGETYWYRVCAVDRSGNESGPSAPAGVTPQGNAAPGTFSISGKAVFGAAGLAGATIRAGTSRATTDEAGSFLIDGLPAGVYSVTAEKSGYTFGGAQEVTVGPNRGGLRFPAALEGLTVSGRVTVEGKPIEGAVVAWYSAHGKKTKTDAEGGYTLTGFEPGTYTLTVTREPYYFATRQVTVTESRTTVDIEGERTYAIRGRVLHNGVGVGGVEVAWYSARGRKTITDMEGNYILTGPTAGTWTVAAKKEGYSWKPLKVTVGPDRDGIDFVSGDTGYTISGKVLWKGKPVRNAKVALLGTGARTWTGTDGAYRLVGLKRGTYTVRAKKPGLRIQKRRVTVGPSRSQVLLAASK